MNAIAEDMVKSYLKRLKSNEWESPARANLSQIRKTKTRGGKVTSAAAELQEPPMFPEEVNVDDVSIGEFQEV